MRRMLRFAHPVATVVRGRGLYVEFAQLERQDKPAAGRRTTTGPRQPVVDRRAGHLSQAPGEHRARRVAALTASDGGATKVGWGFGRFGKGPSSP